MGCLGHTHSCCEPCEPFKQPGCDGCVWTGPCSVPVCGGRGVGSAEIVAVDVERGIVMQYDDDEYPTLLTLDDPLR